MPRFCLAVAVLASLLACGEGERVEPVTFAEVCGQRGPVRLLELSPGRQLESYTTPLRVDDRLYFRTGRGVHDPKVGPRDTDIEIWSTGLCGESPRRMSADIRWLSLLGGRWPGFIFGCDDRAGGLVTVDPDDGHTMVFLPSVTCVDIFSERGVVAVEPDENNAAFAALVLHPYPGTPAEPPPLPLLLHPQVRIKPALADPQIPRSMLLTVRPDEILALDAEDQLLRFDLIDGSVTVEAAGVLAFRVSDDGRYLLWQQLVAPGPDPTYTESLVILRDREAETGVALGETALVYTNSPFAFVADGFVAVVVDGARAIRLFDLNDLSIVDLPRGYSRLTIIDDRRWLIESPYHDGIVVLDPSTDERTNLVAREGQTFAVSDESVLFLARDLTRADSQGPLLRIPLDGSDAHLAAPRATVYARFLAQSRLLTPVELDIDGRGPLLLVDLSTGSQRLLDDSVPAAAFRPDAGFGPDHVVYSVDDGDRSGIYVAHLASE